MQERQKWQDSQQTDTLTSQLTAHYPGIWPQKLLAIPKFTMYLTSSSTFLKAPFFQWMGMEEHSAPLLASWFSSWTQNSSYQIKIWRYICNTLYLFWACISSSLEVKSTGKGARSKFRNKLSLHLPCFSVSSRPAHSQILIKTTQSSAWALESNHHLLWAWQVERIMLKMTFHNGGGKSLIYFKPPLRRTELFSTAHTWKNTVSQL